MGLLTTNTKSGLASALGSRSGAQEIENLLGLDTVLKHGADPTGSRDSYSAFASALSASDSVLIPPGTYKLSQKLTVAALKRLVGSGMFATTITSDVASGEAISIDDGCFLSDFTLQGNATVGTIGIKTASTGARGALQNVRVYRFGTGIEFATCWVWDCYSCYFTTNATYGVAMTGTSCNAIHFYGGEIIANGKGVYLSPGATGGFTGIGFFGTSIEGNDTHGVHVDVGSGASIRSLHFHGCYFEANGTYDYLQDHDVFGFTMVGNNFHGNTTNGIVLNSGHNGQVSGCYFDTGSASVDVNNSACVNIDVGPNYYGDNAFSTTFDSGTMTEFVLNDETSTKRMLRIVNPVDFSTTAASQCDSIMLHTATAAGNGVHGGSIGWGIHGDLGDNRRAAIASVQLSSDSDNTGLDFYTHDSAGANPLVLAMRLAGDLSCSLQGAIDHNGTTIGFNGAAPTAQSTGWTVTNPVSRKTYDTTTVTTSQLAEVVGTIITYLKLRGDFA